MEKISTGKLAILALAYVGALLPAGIFYELGRQNGLPKRSIIYEPFVKEEKVTADYVKPSQIESLEWRDVDGDGKLETTIKLSGKDYLFRWEGKDKPVLKGYSVTPAKTEPAKIIANDYSKVK